MDLAAFATVVLLVLGVSLVGVGYLDHQNERSDVANAVEVGGTVIDTGIEVRYVQSDSGAGTGSVRYAPVVRYRYTYGGREYASDSIFPGAETSFNTQSRARTVVNGFPVGHTVPVYVNAEVPSRSFLLDETDPSAIVFTTVAGGVAVFLAISIGVHALIARRDG